MTKAQVEVITSVQRRRRWSRGGEGTDCCRGDWSRARSPPRWRVHAGIHREPTVPLAAAALRAAQRFQRHSIRCGHA